MSFEVLAKQDNSTRYETLAATILPRIREIRKESIKASLTGLTRIEHRLEYVLSIQNIEFINDSRSTSVNSTWFALTNYMKPIVWIAGGVESGNDYRDLIPAVRERVKAIVCLGHGNQKIIDTFSPLGLPITSASNMDDAVLQSYYLANPGDVVLLSPACASFDLFTDFEERGKAFKRAVKNL
jgi:UDP-N-acetylmuramoylalanine--D-glutamate ligase